MTKDRLDRDFDWLLAAIVRLAAHAYVTVDEADSSGSSGVLIERAIERVMPHSEQRARRSRVSSRWRGLCRWNRKGVAGSRG